jgi:uncharacterized protein YggE
MGHRFALVTFLTTLAAASPATALQRLTDTGNDHWVEVTGEGSVNAAPDFARATLGVTNSGGRTVRREQQCDGDGPRLSALRRRAR